jgi:5'-3' exonuclease
MRVALIDADILAYQAAVVSEQSFDWGDGMWTLHAFEPDAIAAFNTILNTIVDKVEADDFYLMFSDRDNWRKDVLPTYKSNRSGVRKPMLLRFLKEIAEENYKCVSMPGLEGDDVLGIWATQPSKLDPVRELIVCSIDKDFKTIPGKHYNFKSGEFFEVTEHEADYYHMLQTLTGDTTDGYSGCPGVGPVAAGKILQKAMEEGTPWANPAQLREIYWKHVLKAYDKAGFGEEEALVQARVARICRHSDYDHVNKKVILWNPKSTNSLVSP